MDSERPSDERVRREFVLTTGGQDKEFDALGICMQALDGLTKDQCDRISMYLLRRYGFGERV
jgi:hypothetical protein